MTKEYIALYDDARNPHSLGHLNMKEDKYLEDVFHAVADASDLDDVVARLEEVVYITEVEAQTSTSVTLGVLTQFGAMHLKVRVTI